MFESLKNMFTGLLSFNGSVATKYLSLNSEQCKTRPFLIDSNWIQTEFKLIQFKYYPFIIILDKCNSSSNTLSEIFSRICFPNKAGHVNLNVFNFVTRTNK